ncbi:hypothetical protein BV25DRAFT_1838144 [Artomyces pyxidatus]|uniref:Uncharacterized protein n=1 Tax=Artomyces pyxidatus TaxID=48021 RepID=A0ACB8T3H5_9AGAM|nr:hypothetical protein BV25DRAFT_1838144 [Artomyces pyxidatus]
MLNGIQVERLQGSDALSWVCTHAPHIMPVKRSSSSLAPSSNCLAVENVVGRYTHASDDDVGLGLYPGLRLWQASGGRWFESAYLLGISSERNTHHVGLDPADRPINMVESSSLYRTGEAAPNYTDPRVYTMSIGSCTSLATAVPDSQVIRQSEGFYLYSSGFRINGVFDDMRRVSSTQKTSSMLALGILDITMARVNVPFWDAFYGLQLTNKIEAVDPQTTRGVPAIVDFFPSRVRRHPGWTRGTVFEANAREGRKFFLRLVYHHPSRHDQDNLTASNSQGLS